MNGYVQVYTGDGKGKTTAAIGLAIRSLGGGWRVFFAQFLKAGECSVRKQQSQQSLHMLCGLTVCPHLLAFPL